MPTENEKRAVFENLVNNGLSFIERSGEELVQSRPTFAIAHFATGLELLLKARLFAEHWTMASANPHGCSWATVASGKEVTIDAGKLCAAVTTVCGTPLSKEGPLFSNVFKHRNAVLHFVPPENLVEVEKEQCLAWYYLHNLLTKAWASEFNLFVERIGKVERGLRDHRPYLQARFDSAKPRLDGKAIAGLLEQCAACDFKSAELETTARPTIPFSCGVCGASGYFVEFECGKRLSVDDLPVECACDEEHTRDELFARLDTASVDEDQPHCGECSGGEGLNRRGRSDRRIRRSPTMMSAQGSPHFGRPTRCRSSRMTPSAALRIG